MTKHFLLIFIMCLVLFTTSAQAQVTKPDLARLRASFGAAVSKYFTVVKHQIVEHDDKWRGGTYMLIHVRPKKSGRYQLTYFLPGGRQIVLRGRKRIPYSGGRQDM